MRYYIGLILFALFGTLLAVSPPVARSQDRASRGVEISAELLDDYLNVQTVYEPIQLTPIGDPTRAVNAAGDRCVDGAPLPQFFENNSTYIASDLTVVNGYATESSDPSLASCFSGSAPSAQGFRSAWYQFIAPATGTIEVQTVFNASYSELYDTVVAIYSGPECAQLTQLACNDDSNGLLSLASAFIEEGEQYYIEVADRNRALNGDAVVNLIATIESADYWMTDGSWNTNAAFRSRHATAVVGDDIYVIGGQTVVNGIAPIRTARVDKFNTVTGEWTERAPIPATCAGDPSGYSNTAAAYLAYDDENGDARRRIFMPSGYIGDDGNYSPVHCVYDVDTNQWLTDVTAPWFGGDGNAPAFASVAVRQGVLGYYVTGGLTGAWGQEGGTDANGTDVLFFRPDKSTTLRWFAPRPLPSGRFAHTSILIDDNFLCVMGGLENPESGSDLTLIILSNGQCLNLNNTASGWTSISGTNITRFQASSAIGPDGRWYVWGGLTASNNRLVSVAEIEVYDRVTDTWTILDGRYDLNAPARSWARGGFVGDKLFVIGGETDYIISSSDPKYRAGITGIVEQLDFPDFLPSAAQTELFLPLLMENYSIPGLSSQAQTIGFGGTYFNNFNDAADRFDVYEFSQGAAQRVRLELSNMPENDNYDLYLYNSDKVLLAESNSIGTLNEVIDLTLAAGNYFVIVVAEDNDAFTAGDYRLRLMNP